MEQLFQSVLNEYGFIGAIFTCLLVYVLRENSLREGKYQDTIEKNQEVILTQAKNLEVVKDIQDDIADLKNTIVRK